ncbi:outer membrane efflux protein, partial [Sphingomonas sp. LH128]|uniref:TolC family protein n=1 Tax=Sphingomonas sp. LH128 TaxID=473781 RepID=UPI00027CB183
AEADVARQRTALAQDINGLQLLVGVPIANDLLPDRIEQAAQGVKEVPAGVDSRVLLRRPDVIQAEYLMLAANAEIGAARAAMFPRISLTGLLGFASNALSGLFTGGAFRYSGSGDASYAIFQAGAAKAGVRLSQAQRDAALATYEKSIQSAFRDVADGLARRGTIDAEMAAIRRQAVAAEDGYALADARYRRGVDTFLSSLVAQRAAYSARRDIVAIELEAASNRVALFRALGGDARWE